MQEAITGARRQRPSPPAGERETETFSTLALGHARRAMGARAAQRLMSWTGAACCSMATARRAENEGIKKIYRRPTRWLS